MLTRLAAEIGFGRPLLDLCHLNVIRLKSAPFGLVELGIIISGPNSVWIGGSQAAAWLKA